MSEICLELRNIRKSFTEGEEVLQGLNLTVQKGEFITLLGASGCGKTTTLRIIAGLEAPDSGQVFLDGRDVTDFPPEERNVNTVFQNYALFPHMNVADNIGYGLRLRKVPKAEIRTRVEEMLELVKLPGYGKRKPSELSGGQRQRVAIARSLINNPKVLLLDEPLGALDLQLRRAMQIELKRLQKKLGITFVYITHDQEEAINMSDRIAVMNHGTFEQMDAPNEIYNHPRTSYVASFVGNANILRGMVKEVRGDQVLTALCCGDALVETGGEQLRPGEEVKLAVRGEHIHLEQGKSVEKGLEAVVLEKSFAAGQLRVSLKLSDGKEIVASRYGIDANVQPGEKVRFWFAPENAVLVDRDPENAGAAENGSETMGRETSPGETEGGTSHA